MDAYKKKQDESVKQVEETKGAKQDKFEKQGKKKHKKQQGTDHELLVNQLANKTYRQN
jgi:hypothetical protein